MKAKEGMMRSGHEGPVRDTPILVALGVAIAAAVAVTVVYALGGQPQLEGALLGLALGGVAVALIVFARRMLPGGHFVQVREDLPGTAEERASVASAFSTGAEPMERRSLMVKMFWLAMGALGLAALAWYDRLLAAELPERDDLLEGSLGIALVLLAAISSDEPRWDRVLAITLAGG